MSPGISIGKSPVINRLGSVLNYNPATDADLNFRAATRSGLSLVDSIGTNHALILPAVAKTGLSATGNSISLQTQLSLNAGEIEFNYFQSAFEAAGRGCIQGASGASRINSRSDKVIEVVIGSSLKQFTCSNLSYTELNNIKVVFRQDAGVTKARVYCNTVESSSGEIAWADNRSFLFDQIGHVGANIYTCVSYVKVTTGAGVIFESYPNGLGKYEYDISANHQTLTWLLTNTSVYLTSGQPYLLDTGFSIYEKYGSLDEYVPTGCPTTALTTLEYQLKETHAASSTKHNLAPSLIQFVGAEFDRSDATIWSNSARAGYYDATSATTKKRWHITECTQYNFGTWANEAYKEIIFVNYQYSTHADGRALTEIFCSTVAKTGNNLALIYKYIGYNYKVGSLTTQFVVDTITGQLDWVDISGGLAQYEISRSVNGGTRAVVATTAAGAITYNDTTCKQGAWVVYYIRAKVGSVYSDYFRTTILSTPLCWKTDQSVLTAVVLKTLSVTSGTVNVNWGDGTNANYTGANANLTKNYSVVGQYNIVLSGDLKRIYALEHFDQIKSYGSIANWVFPTDYIVFHMYGCSFTGDVSDHFNYIKPALKIYDAQRLPITGDVSWWRWALTTVYDIHFEYTGVTGDITLWDFPELVNSASAKIMLHMSLLTGNLSAWRLPDGMNILSIYGSHFTIDLTNFYVPRNLVIIDICSHEAENTNTVSGDMTNFQFADVENSASGNGVNLSKCNLTGDMSSVLIPNYTKPVNICFSYNAITKMPRGHYKWVQSLNFIANQCNSSEIDNFLAYVDNYFTGGIVPLTNGSYNLSGIGMGVPSAAGLASRTSIINKYIAAGKTCSIGINS